MATEWQRRNRPVHRRCHGCWNLDVLCQCNLTGYTALEQMAGFNLPSTPPANLNDRLNMLAEQLGIKRFSMPVNDDARFMQDKWDRMVHDEMKRLMADPCHPSQYTPEIVGYDPVAEAERLLYYQDED